MPRRSSALFSTAGLVKLAADLGALKACQSCFGNHLLEGQLTAELRHVVIRPADRRNAEFCHY